MNQKRKVRGPSVPPAKRKSIAYRAILSKLVAGDLPAGVPLSEVTLAKELGISRTPVREAIGQLAGEGILEQVAGRGTMVRQITRHDIVELYELREALEVFAVGRAASRRLHQADLTHLTRLVDELERMHRELNKNGAQRLDGEGMRRFISDDLLFHSLIIRAAGNSRILKVVGDMRLLMRIFALPHEGHTAPQLAEIHREHREILNALSAGDAVRCQKMLAEHIRVSMRERIAAYDDWERREKMSSAFLHRPELATNLLLGS